MPRDAKSIAAVSPTGPAPTTSTCVRITVPVVSRCSPPRSLQGARLVTTVRSSKFAPRRRCVQVLAVALSLSLTEGAGKAGRRNAPVDPARRSTRASRDAAAHGQRTTGEADHADFPRAMVYGLYVLSPVSGVCCHRCQTRTGGPDRRHGRGARTTRLRRPRADVSPVLPPDASPRPSHPAPNVT